MKRNIMIIITFAILLTSCSSKKNDLKIYNLKGNVWKIKETTYEGKEEFGTYQIGEKKYYGHNLYVFNEDGNLLESQLLNKKGDIETVSKYSYDQNGNCTEIIIYEDEEVLLKQVNQINNNQIIELQVFNEDGKLAEKYQYDYSGTDISGVKVFNGDGSLKMTSKYEFSDGLLTKQIVKDSLEQITSINIFERNKEGDVITKIVEYPKDKTEQTYSFEYDYDENENWLKNYQFDEDGKIDDILVRNIIYYGQSISLKTDKDFIGIWFVVDNKDWIEFRSDKKYDSGYKDRIKETGAWEIDTKQQILTFRAEDPDDSRKYKYDFEGNQMILFTIQNEEKLRLEKR